MAYPSLFNDKQISTCVSAKWRMSLRRYFLTCSPWFNRKYATLCLNYLSMKEKLRKIKFTMSLTIFTVKFWHNQKQLFTVLSYAKSWSENKEGSKVVVEKKLHNWNIWMLKCYIEDWCLLFISIWNRISIPENFISRTFNINGIIILRPSLLASQKCFL